MSSSIIPSLWSIVLIASTITSCTSTGKEELLFYEALNVNLAAMDLNLEFSNAMIYENFLDKGKKPATKTKARALQHRVDLVRQYSAEMIYFIDVLRSGLIAF